MAGWLDGKLEPDLRDQPAGVVSAVVVGSWSCGLCEWLSVVACGRIWLCVWI